MKHILAATLSLLILFQLLGPFISPGYYCSKGVLNMDRGPLFGKSQAVEIYQGVAITIPCAPGQHKLPQKRKEYDI